MMSDKMKNALSLFVLLFLIAIGVGIYMMQMEQKKTLVTHHIEIRTEKSVNPKDENPYHLMVSWSIPKGSILKDVDESYMLAGYDQGACSYGWMCWKALTEPHEEDVDNPSMIHLKLGEGKLVLAFHSEESMLDAEEAYQNVDFWNEVIEPKVKYQQKVVEDSKKYGMKSSYAP